MATLLLGWVSGIFSALRKRPEFKIEVLPGPSLCTTFATGNKHENFDAHKTAIATYLRITNIGNAPASIDTVNIGYHWNITGISRDWMKYKVGWFNLVHPIIAMDVFQFDFDNQTKYYPFLLQGENTNTYLEIGKTTNGVVYFEQKESWGGCSPQVRNNKTKLKIVVFDSYGKKYKIKALIDVVSLIEAQKYNPAFGQTFSSLSKSNESKEKT